MFTFEPDCPFADMNHNLLRTGNRNKCPAVQFHSHRRRHSSASRVFNEVPLVERAQIENDRVCLDAKTFSFETVRDKPDPDHLSPARTVLSIIEFSNE